MLAQPPAADRDKQVTALIAAGKLEDAVEACNAWVKEDGTATRPHFLLAEVFIRLKNWERAQEELEVVLDLNPASTSGHVKLGDLLRRQHKLDKANEEYHKALEIDSKCVEAFLGLAGTALLGDKPDEAAAAVDMALNLAPENALVLAFAGALAHRAGKLAEAAAKFRQALEKDPQCPEALSGLAVLVQVQGTPAAEAEAQQLWDRFLEVGGDPDRMWQVRNGLVILGRKELRSNPFTDFRVVFSPDGNQLAFCGISDISKPRTWELYVAPVDGSAPPRVITTGGGSQFANWMPDGKRILFDFLYQPTGTKSRSFITSAAGDEAPKCLTPDLAISRNAAPLPGTDRILFSDAFAFYTMKDDGTDRQKLPLTLPPSSEANQLAVSPDGKRIAFLFTRWDEKREGGPAHHIAVAPLDGSKPLRRITADYPAGRSGYAFPAWSPDGKRIAYQSDEFHPLKSADVFVQVLDDPHPPVRIVQGARPGWSPDGSRIVYTVWTPQDPGAICIVRLGGKRLPIVKP